MKRRLMILLALLVGSPVAVQAQRSTERYIPIGQSPGLSGKVTLIGVVSAVDAADASIAVQTAAGARRVKWSAQTQLWLDRSAQRQPTQNATPADLRAGRRVEVKPGADSVTADWIKIDGATAP